MTEEQQKLLSTYLTAAEIYRQAWETQNTARVVYEQADRNKTEALKALGSVVGRNITRRLFSQAGRTVVVEYRDGWDTPNVVIFDADGEETR